MKNTCMSCKLVGSFSPFKVTKKMFKVVDNSTAAALFITAMPASFVTSRAGISGGVINQNFPTLWGERFDKTWLI